MTLEIARQIAEKAHAGQKRKNGEDYINHCIRVSNMAAEYSEEAAIVGMLHDVIEDSEVFASYLFEQGFSDNVMYATCYMTHSKDECYLRYILELLHYGRITEAGKIAIQVKICDLKDNLNGATGTLRDKYMMAYYILTGEVYND